MTWENSSRHTKEYKNPGFATGIHETQGATISMY